MKQALVLAAVAALSTPLAGAPASPGGRLLVANKGDHTLGLVEPGAGRQVAALAESGVTAHEVAASPDGRFAYLPIYGDAGVGRPGRDGTTIDVFDLGAHRRVATIDLGRPERPHAARFGRDGRLYVTTELTSTITVIDPRTNSVVDRIPTGQAESHMLALSRDGRRAWTSNVGPGTVSAIDLAAKKVVAVTTTSQVAVVDLKEWKVTRAIDVPKAPQEVVVRPDGRVAYVSCDASGKVAAIDLATWAVDRLIDAGPFVDGLAWAPLSRDEGRRAEE